MRIWRKSMAFVTSVTLTCFSATPTFAQDAKLAFAADFIVSTADRICKAVRSEGTAKSEKVQGQINAQVKGLAGKLTGIGVGGAAGGEHSQHSYSNVIQADLPALMVSEQQCRDRVFDSLKSLLVSSAAAPRVIYKSGPARTVVRPIYDLHSIHMRHFNLSIGNIRNDDCITALGRTADANKNVIERIPTTGPGLAYIVGGAKTFMTCEGGWITVTVAGFNLTNLDRQADWAEVFVRTVLPEPTK